MTPRPHDIVLLALLAVGLVFGSPAPATAQSGDGSRAEDLRDISKALQRLRSELSHARQQFENQVKALQDELQTVKARVGAGSGSAGPKGAATVCRTGCRYSDLQTAIDRTGPGDTLTIAPGLYAFCAVVHKPVRLVGLKGPGGQRAHLGGGTCRQKGALVVASAGVVIEGLEISHINVRHENGACIRIDPVVGDVVVRDLLCYDSENGILGGPSRGSVLIEDSIFERNGRGGRAHGIYISKGDELIFRNSAILSSKGHGHSLKSGARRTVVEGSVIAALEGVNSRALDVYGGGEVVIRGNVIQQGRNSDNHEAIGLAVEPNRLNPAPHTTLVEDNWVIFDDRERCCRWLFFAKPYGPIAVRNNRIVGMTHFSEQPLPMEESGNTLYQTREAANLPAYDRSARSLPTP